MSESSRWDEMANMVALIVDAQACAKRLAELRAAHKEMDEKVARDEKALSDIAVAHQDLQQKMTAAEGLMKDAERWQGQLDALKKSLDVREGEVAFREKEAAQAVSNAKFREDKCGERENTIAHRETALKLIEKSADDKLAAASKLMESYDQAKHEAALKLAG